MDSIEYKLCNVCNERIPSIRSVTYVKNMCRRCYAEKTKPKKTSPENNNNSTDIQDETIETEEPLNRQDLPKRFSAENFMDPGEVPDELKSLTEIEEMLIAQVFTVMTVFRFRGGQTIIAE